jgi:hypothetical protein
MSFIGDKQPLPWEMRVRVAYHVAQALDHCSMENRKIYHDLNAYRILFDEVWLQTNSFVFYHHSFSVFVLILIYVDPFF